MDLRTDPDACGQHAHEHRLASLWFRVTLTDDAVKLDVVQGEVILGREVHGEAVGSALK
jgi:hypothetical protein